MDGTVVRLAISPHPLNFTCSAPSLFTCVTRTVPRIRARAQASFRFCLTVHHFALDFALVA